VGFIEVGDVPVGDVLVGEPDDVPDVSDPESEPHA
jgi:hypothetical protein